MPRVSGITRVTHGRGDGIHVEHRAVTRTRVRAAVKLVEQRAAGVSHLLLRQVTPISELNREKMGQAQSKEMETRTERKSNCDIAEIRKYRCATGECR